MHLHGIESLQSESVRLEGKEADVMREYLRYGDTCVEQLWTVE